MATSYRPVTDGAGQEVVNQLKALLSMIQSGKSSSVSSEDYTDKSLLTESTGRSIASQLASLITAFATYAAPSAKKLNHTLTIGTEKFDGSADKTISEATTSAAGLLSATDKAKLNGIESGAQKNTVTGVKGHSETKYRTGQVDITAENVGAEPAFSKNTAFNKNFGTAAGTVCQGNDGRLSDARTPKAHTHEKADVGLGNVDNVRQYSASNPPPYPVTSVNSKTGAVSIAKGDVGLGNVDNVKQYSASNPPPYPVTKVNGKTGAVEIALVDLVGKSPIGDDYTPIYWNGSKFVAQEPTLENASWDVIAALAESGRAKSLFKVGAEKKVQLKSGGTATFVILGFEHDDLSDGTGKACITFGMKNLLADYYSMNGSSTNEGGWDQSEMRNSTMQSLLEDLPDDLVKVIKTVKKRTSAGNTSTDIVTSDDSLWLLSLAEICSERAIRNSAWSSISDYADTYMGEGEQYDYYKSAAGDIDPNDANDGLVKSLDDGGGSTDIWWLRSPNVGNSSYFLCVYYDGYVRGDYADGSSGVCLGFCV